MNYKSEPPRQTLERVISSFASYGNSRVVKFDRQGNFLKSWGRFGSGPGEFNLPHSVVVGQDGRVYVDDRENKRIQIFDGEGNFLKEWTGIGYPYGLFITRDQRICMADGGYNRIVELDSNGKFSARSVNRVMRRANSRGRTSSRSIRIADFMLLTCSPGGFKFSRRLGNQREIRDMSRPSANSGVQRQAQDGPAIRKISRLQNDRY